MKINDVRVADLALLNSRILMVLIEFVDSYDDADTLIHLKKLLKDYAYDREAVQKAFKWVFSYLRNDRTINKKATKKDIEKIKKIVNETARLVWKTKKSRKK